jgi:hypothetical protein
VFSAQEVKRFLWINHFCAPPEDICVITPHLSVVDAHLAGASAQVGLTARSFIERTDFAGIERQKKLAPSALSTLQAVDRKTFKSRQDEVFKRWIENLIPAAGPGGKLLSIKEKAELINYCYAYRNEFFSACPALAVEDALTAARTANPNRKPQTSDGIDLMHTVIALEYSTAQGLPSAREWNWRPCSRKKRLPRQPLPLQGQVSWCFASPPLDNNRWRHFQRTTARRGKSRRCGLDGWRNLSPGCLGRR